MVIGIRYFRLSDYHLEKALGLVYLKDLFEKNTSQYSKNVIQEYRYEIGYELLRRSTNHENKVRFLLHNIFLVM